MKGGDGKIMKDIEVIEEALQDKLRDEEALQDKLQDAEYYLDMQTDWDNDRAESFRDWQ